MTEVNMNQSVPGDTRDILLDDIVGQQKFVDTMKVSIAASRMRGEILPHILLVGPRGSGKSTLAKAIANELGANMQIVSFSALRTPSDLEPILTRVSEGDIIYIENFDSVRLSHADILAPAMDSFAMDIVLGKGAYARNIHLDLPRFTLIATMDSEKKIPSKLRGCFSIYWRMLDYTNEELEELVKRFAGEAGISMTDDAVVEVSKHSDGSYRKLNTIMKRARDFALIKGNEQIDIDVITQVLETFL